MNWKIAGATIGVAALGVIAAQVWQARAPAQDATRAPKPVQGATPVQEIVARTTTGRSVIFIGLDGADWTLLDDYVSRGVMPALGKLVKEGTTGTLTTLHPPLSPLIWTTMVTGVSPLEHRILDFLRVDAASSRREPVSSIDRKTPAVWNMATYGGKRVGAVGFWATYPAETVNGLIVSDRLFTFLYSESSPPPGVVYPAALESWARETLRRAEEATGYGELRSFLPWLGEAEYRQASATTNPYSHPVSALRRILIETHMYHTLARDWLARERPDLMLVYFQGTDSIGHVFAPYAPPRQPSIPANEYERYSGVPEKYFAAVDGMIDEYRKLAEASGSVLMIASDHGFTWTEGRPTALSSVANATAARWHTDNGIYLLWGPRIPPSTGHEHHGTVQQVCATLLALLGLPQGKNVLGPPLPGARAAAAAVDYQAHYSPTAPVASAPPAVAQKAEEETVARLRALGYIGASEASGRTSGDRTAGSFNNEGLLLKQQGKTTEAIEAFDRALSVDPMLASAMWNLSDLLFARNESLDKSDVLLVRAFANGLPEGTKFLIGRAIGYQRNGQIDRSLKLMTMAAAAKPDEPEVWLFRGRYRVETGDCAGALTDFEQATRLTPTNAAAFASQGLARLCVGDTAGARQSFLRSLQLDPNQPKVRDYLRSSRH